MDDDSSGESREYRNYLRSFNHRMQVWEAKDEARNNFGLAAIRISLAINGAAAVALLAFLGHLWTQRPVPVMAIESIAAELLNLVWAVFATALATGAGYFALDLDSAEVVHEMNETKPRFWRWELTVEQLGKFARCFTAAAVVLVAISYFLFISTMCDLAEILENPSLHKGLIPSLP